MSLINKMLRDLESGANQAANGPAALRATTTLHPKRWAPLDWLIAITCIVVGFVSVVLATLSFTRPAQPAKGTPVVRIKAAAQADQASTTPPPPLPPVAQPALTAAVAAAPTATPASPTPPPPPSPIARSGEKSAPGTTSKAAPLPLPAVAPSADNAPKKTVADKRPSEELASRVAAKSSSKNNKVANSNNNEGDGLLTITPSNDRADGEYRKALQLLADGRNTDALESLRKALKEAPRHVAARTTLINLLITQHRNDEAQGLLQEALAQPPRLPKYALLLARLQLDRNDAQGACNTMKQTLPEGQSDPAYRSFYALLLQRTGQLKESIEQYKEAVSLAPSDGRWWLGLAAAYEAAGNNTKAYDAYAQASATRSLQADLQSFVDHKLRNQSAN